METSMMPQQNYQARWEITNMTQSTKAQIRKRIEALKQDPWSFDVEDQIVTLKQQLTPEMGMPHYERIS